MISNWRLTWRKHDSKLNKVMELFFFFSKLWTSYAQDELQAAGLEEMTVCDDDAEMSVFDINQDYLRDHFLQSSLLKRLIRECGFQLKENLIFKAE